MNVTLRLLAEWVDGEIDGDGDLAIADARPVGDARPGDITFAADDRHLEQFHHGPAAAAFVPLGTSAGRKPVILVRDPLAAFAAAFRRFRPATATGEVGVHPSAAVHPSALLGRDVAVGPFVAVGAGSIIGPRTCLAAGVVIGANCRLGSDVVLHPHVVLYDGTHLGDRVVIHAHSVIGADGFGYRRVDGRHVKVPQLGHVEIGDDVEIGACTTIDRGTFGPTTIGDGTKIDNLVQVGHNCRIGRHNLLIAQAGIAGSCTSGEGVIVAGQAGVRDHVHLGDGAILGPQTGVSKCVATNQHVMGTPAVPLRDWKLAAALSAKLPHMRKTLRRVAKHLGLTEDES